MTTDNRIFRIRTSLDIDPSGVGVWEVRADWHGAYRTVYAGSMQGCLAYVRRFGEGG